MDNDLPGSVLKIANCDDLNCLKNGLLSPWKTLNFWQKKNKLYFFFYKFLISVSEIAVMVSQRSLTLVAHMSTYTVNAFPANLYVPEDITVLLKHLAPIEE